MALTPVSSSEDRRGGRYFSTKELALIITFSAAWTAAQIYMGPALSQIIRVHGVVNRLVGWALMLVLAEITKKFGAVSTMATIAALATRIIRRAAIEGMIVGLGYALGGIAFDLLASLPSKSKLRGRNRNMYLLFVSTVSGTAASLPYILVKLSVLGVYGFLALAPIYVYSTLRGTILSVVGTIAGLSVLSRSIHREVS